MPSSNKTPFMELNQWASSDKPKRSDFNSDNSKIDQQIQMMASALTSQQEAMQTNTQGIAAQAAQLSEHTGAASIHLNSADREKLDGLTAGAGGGGPKHLTYTGNGSAMRTITFGYKPRFGIIFAVAYPPIGINDGYCDVNSGFFTDSLVTMGMDLTSNGIVVFQQGTPQGNGAKACLNRNSVQYVCMLWE